MRKEIRDLRVGEYWNSDNDAVLSIKRTDDGIIIQNADTETGWVYTWLISPEGKVISFDFVDIFDAEDV